MGGSDGKSTMRGTKADVTFGWDQISLGLG